MLQLRMITMLYLTLFLANFVIIPCLNGNDNIDYCSAGILESITMNVR